MAFSQPNSQQKNIFSQNSSQILNNGSIPFDLYAVKPEQFQYPASQMSQRDAVLDERTQKRQRDLLSLSVSNNPQENQDFSLNNYVRNSNESNIFLKPPQESSFRSQLVSRSITEKPVSSYGQDLKRQVFAKFYWFFLTYCRFCSRKPRKSTRNSRRSSWTRNCCWIE